MRRFSERAPRLLASLIGATIVFNLIGLVIAVAEKYPGEFDCTCDRDSVLGDSVTTGSLLAAPITTLVALAVAALLVWRARRWLAMLGAAGALGLGVIFIIATIGEPLHPEKSDPPFAFLLAWRIVGVGLAAGLVVLAAACLFGRLTGGDRASPHA